MKRLWEFAKRYRRRFGFGIFLLLCTNATTMAIPQLFRFAIDAINAGAPSHDLKEIALVLVALAAGGAIFRVRSRVHLFFAARDVEMDLRCCFYEHLTALSPAFFETRSTGDLMSRATNDLTQIRLLLGPGVLNVVNTAVAYLTAIPLMFLISVKLTMLVLLVYPPSFFIMQFLARRLYQRNREQQMASGAIAGVVQENLTGAHVVRAFGIEEPRRRHFEARNRAYYQTSVRLAYLRAGMFRLVVTIANTTIMVAVYVGAKDAIAGTMTMGEVVAITEYMALLAWPTFALGWVMSMWQRGSAAMERMAEVLDIAPEIRSGPLRPETLEPSLRVNHLNFAYGDTAILRDISFELEPGATLGIVGPIGAGKTTLLKALMRLINVDAQAVYLGGYDITDLDLASLRRAFGYVAQTPGLFSKTLAQNVAFGMPEASEQRITAALMTAGLKNDLQVLPQGLATPVGERGVTLSGGQKQRTAIARALLLNPPILLLDDSLSAVDTETEAEILGHLRSLRRDRTTVIVAHRMSAVKHADLILVLDAGRIVERGTHDSLMQQGGLYATMTQRQELQHPSDVEQAS